MFAVINEAASLRLRRKLNFTRIIICDFHRHHKLANISGCTVILGILTNAIKTLILIPANNYYTQSRGRTR